MELRNWTYSPHTNSQRRVLQGWKYVSRRYVFKIGQNLPVLRQIASTMFLSTLKISRYILILVHCPSICQNIVKFIHMISVLLCETWMQIIASQWQNSTLIFFCILAVSPKSPFLILMKNWFVILDPSGFLRQLLSCIQFSSTGFMRAVIIRITHFHRFNS